MIHFLRTPHHAAGRLAAAVATVAVALAMTAAAPEARAEIRIGKAATDFTLTNEENDRITLSSFAGSYVVLEWLNHGCPYVKKHYKTDNMQSLQRKYTEKGVVWLSIISSTEGKQGYSSPDQAKVAKEERNAAPTHILLDTKGDVGRLYGARTTPHMFIIDPEGKIVYMGAMDDDDSFFAWGVDGAKNYVAQALDQAMAGEPVSEAITKPYGCSVKY